MCYRAPTRRNLTKDGCCVTCISGDKACCDMIQGYCDCLMDCMKAGCTCCMMMGGVENTLTQVGSTSATRSLLTKRLKSQVLMAVAVRNSRECCATVM